MLSPKSLMSFSTACPIRSALSSRRLAARSFIELLDHSYRGPHILLKVKRRGAHVEQCTDRLSGVLLHVPKSTGLCREIEVRDLDDPPTGFPLDDEPVRLSRFHWPNHPFPRHGAKRSWLLRGVPAGIVG